uniref:LisH domain-containing protein n=1 Tax=Phaeocystis antarctica TaxID=33657 RepID=A0A7S0HX00_9EUKA|mmetsp:Transcript_3807/g.8570  ORF Transcript_3807/g.8570 Transcript_3807/m.8570 type:complete len:174 (+) Transcript_3807:76-597(+)
MSVDELKTALRETLDRRGILGTMRAHLQSEIFSAIDSQDDARPVLSYENMMMNELIREYLEFNQYRHTLSVFLSESGQPAERLRRQHLSQQLLLPPLQTAGDGSAGSSRDMPLLYSLLEPSTRGAPDAQPTQTAPKGESQGFRADGTAAMRTDAGVASRGFDPAPFCFTTESQ